MVLEDGKSKIKTPEDLLVEDPELDWKTGVFSVQSERDLSRGSSVRALIPFMNLYPSELQRPHLLIWSPWDLRISTQNFEETNSTEITDQKNKMY
jgi:hypothetical protein